MSRLPLILILAAFIPALASADPEIPDVSYPPIPASSAGAAGFTPAGWKVEATASGDLNGDGLADLALILRQTSARNILANPDGMGENPFNTNPRILVVAFKVAGVAYRLQLANHTLIPRRDDPVRSDFIEEDALSIQRGALRITMHDFMSAGGWGMGNRTFIFRYQVGQFQLIGFNNVLTERNTGKVTTTSINYSTGRASIAVGSIESDAETTRTVTLPRRPLLTLDQVDDGMEFDPGV